jgi:hypothetical protein
MKHAWTLACLLFATTACADWPQVVSATARITTPGTGTAVVYRVDDDSIWLLTAGHCTAHTDTVQVEFFRDGRPLPLVRGQVVLAINESRERDVGIVKVAAKDLGHYRPPAIPLGDPERDPALGQQVVSCGCSDGAWPTLFLGHVDEIESPRMFNVTPSVRPGRSGSGVFDHTGERILGILTRESGGTVGLRQIKALAGRWTWR